MSIPISRLVVKLSGDNKELASSLKKGSKDVDTFGDKAKAGAEKAAKAMAAVAAAAAAAATAIGAAVLDQAGKIDAITKSARNLAIGTREFVGLKLAAEEAGIPVATLERSFGKMTLRIGKAAQEFGPANNAFKQLGLNAEELAKNKPDQNFKLIVDRLKEIPNPAKRAQIAQDVLGKSAQEMGSLIAGGSEAIDAATAAADRMGLTFDEGAGRAIESFNDNMGRLAMASEGVARQFTIGLAPGLQFLTNEMLAMNNEVGEGPKRWKDLGESVGHWIRDVVIFVKQAGNNVQLLFGMLDRAQIRMQIAIRKGLNSWLEDVNASIRKLTGPLQWLAEKAGKTFDPANFQIASFAVGELNQELANSVQASKDLQDENDKIAVSTTKSFQKATSAVREFKQAAGVGDFNAGAASIPGKSGKSGKTKTAKAPKSGKSSATQESLSPFQQWVTDLDDLDARLEEFTVGTFKDFSDALGGAVASVFVLGESFEDTFANIGKQAVASLIGAMVSLATQMVITAVLGEVITKSAVASGTAAAATAGAASATAGAASAATWGQAALSASIATFGAAAGIGSAAMLAAIGATTAAQAGSIVALSAIGAVAGQAHGGLENVPSSGTYLLDKGEAVLQPEQNRDLRDFLKSGGSNVTIINNAGVGVRTQQTASGLRVVLDAVRDDFARSLATGSGTFSNTLRKAGYR